MTPFEPFYILLGMDTRSWKSFVKVMRNRPDYGDATPEDVARASKPTEKRKRGRGRPARPDPPVPYPRPPSPEALAKALRRKPAKRSA